MGRNLKLSFTFHQTEMWWWGYYYYYYLYLLYIVYSPVCPQTNHVPRGYTVAATLSFYCQHAVWCVSPSFLRWFWWSSTSALSGECVQCLIWLLYVILLLLLFLLLLRYKLIEGFFLSQVTYPVTMILYFLLIYSYYTLNTVTHIFFPLAI